MQNRNNYQNEILDELCQNHIPVTLFLMNGYQMRGFVKKYDDFVLIIEVDGRVQMIYKHAISTVTPHSPIEAMA